MCDCRRGVIVDCVLEDFKKMKSMRSQSSGGLFSHEDHPPVACLFSCTAPIFADNVTVID